MEAGETVKITSTKNEAKWQVTQLDEVSNLQYQLLFLIHALDSRMSK